MSKTEKATREYLQTLTKDRVIDLCLQFMFDIEVTGQERDTWQKACELACETMTKLGGDDCCGCRLNKEMCNICENKKALIDYFYQQAKTEGVSR